MSDPSSAFYSSSVGKKVTMALTGFVVFGFVLVHLSGNLQIFQGPEKLNSYAGFLQGLGPILWVFRLVLLVCAVLHMVAAAQITLTSWRARPARYKVYRYRQSNYAARTMRWGGPIIALFVIYHLLHFTFGSIHPAFTPNVYNNVVLGFQNPWISAVYVTAIVFLSLHLYHGLWSMFQSTGAAHKKWNRWRRGFAAVFAIAVGAAGVAVPVAVLLGIVVPV